MEKSREAFRTISEVAEWLDVPTHVLRFWESRFAQIKPVKRAGGRRYYRPSDMRVIGGVKTLLHDQGMTIRGVQKLFREQGLRHVSSFSPELFGEGLEDEDVLELEVVAEASDIDEAPAAPAPAARSTRDAVPSPVIEEAEEPQPDEAEEPEIVFIPRQRTAPAPEPEPAPAPKPVAAPRPVIPATPDVAAEDPTDDDPSHPVRPGVAARLAATRRSDLRPHRDALQEVASRLRKIRGRLD